MSEREREMTNESISIIIKVGKKSNMKFSHSKAYRALIPEDLDILHRSHPDCHLVIIENIKADEEDAVRKFIQSFESESDENKVLFYIPDEDDLETLGLADELNFDIYMTLEDIYFAMKGLGYSLDVAATLDSRREYFKEMSKAEDLEGVTDIFGGVGEIQDSIDKENINTDESIDKENESIEEENESIEEENWQEDFDVSDTPSEDSYTSEKKVSRVSLAKDTSEEDEADLFEGMGSFEDELETVEENSDSTQEIESNASELNETDNEKIDKLRTKLRDARYDYGMAVKDVQEANKRIEDLENVIKALKDEKKDIVDRFNAIKDNGEVFDDADYSELEGKLQQSTSSIAELTAELDKEKSEIENLTTDLNDKVEQLNELNSKIESGEIHAEIVADYEKKLSELSDKYNDALKKFENEQGKVNEISDNSNKELELMSSDLTNVKNERDKFKGDIDRLNKQLKSSEEKVENITKERDDLKKKVESLEKEKKDLTKERDNLKAECDGLKGERDTLKINVGDLETDKETLTERVETLEKEKSELEQKKSSIEGKQASLANDANSKILEQQGDVNSQHKDEIDKLKQQISGLETKLKLTNEQLEQKEQQYSVLVAQQADKSAGASALASTNQTLEIVNKTLSEQLSVANKEITALKNSRTKLTSEVKNYKDKCNQLDSALKNTVKALGSGAGNTEKKEQTSNSNNNGIGYQYLTVKPINYTGSAKIIPVFGCGGTGITTAAVSLASKICLTSNVLYIDMDITQASADAWFGQTPLCGGFSGLGLMDIECTGLGIFYEKGFNIFNNNLDKIIKNVEHTKGGGTDYLSGLIHRVDDERIANADYTSLFNRLGEKYTYIVVDLGGVGNSRINDSLIKAIFDISATNMAVVPQNYFSIRNFLLKVNEAKVDMRKLKLVINMCTATALDRRTKQALTSKSISKYVMLLSDQNMVCIKDTFIHNKLNRDKFAAFVNSDLF